MIKEASSPRGTIHLVRSKLYHGLERTVCGITFHRALGWGRARRRSAPRCRHCLELVA